MSSRLVLQALVKKDVKFVFDEECVRSFKQLKTELITTPVLCLYNSRFETELHTNASSRGFGAILLQKQASKCMVPY